MITINTLTISSDKKSLTVQLTTDVGETITSVNLWTEDTFKDSTKAKDLSSKLTGSTNTESFVILASDLGLTVFDGLYFIEFTNSNNILEIGAVAELSTYKKCLLDNTLEILSSGEDICKKGQNNPKLNKLIYIHVILNALQSAIISGYYGEAIDSIKVLKKFCSSCQNCVTLNSILTIGTLNNNIILI